MKALRILLLMVASGLLMAALGAGANILLLFGCEELDSALVIPYESFNSAFEWRGMLTMLDSVIDAWVVGALSFGLVCWHRRQIKETTLWLKHSLQALLHTVAGFLCGAVAGFIVSALNLYSASGRMPITAWKNPVHPAPLDEAWMIILLWSYFGMAAGLIAATIKLLRKNSAFDS